LVVGVLGAVLVLLADDPLVFFDFGFGVGMLAEEEPIVMSVSIVKEEAALEDRLVFFAFLLRSFSSSSEDGQPDVDPVRDRRVAATTPNEGARLKDCLVPFWAPLSVLKDGAQNDSERRS
jgi:hypothetical protein